MVGGCIVGLSVMGGMLCYDNSTSVVRLISIGDC